MFCKVTHILTQGLLGSNYISLVPGFDMSVLKGGDVIETTHSALILENLVGQLIYNLKNGGNDNNSASDSNNSTNGSSDINDNKK